MEELAQFLLEKESITGKEFMKIFHEHIPEEPEEEEAAGSAMPNFTLVDTPTEQDDNA